MLWRYHKKVHLGHQGGGLFIVFWRSVLHASLEQADVNSFYYLIFLDSFANNTYAIENIGLVTIYILAVTADPYALVDEFSATRGLFCQAVSKFSTTPLLD
jgi:hypothetical protein